MGCMRSSLHSLKKEYTPVTSASVHSGFPSTSVVISVKTDRLYWCKTGGQNQSQKYRMSVPRNGMGGDKLVAG